MPSILNTYLIAIYTLLTLNLSVMYSGSLQAQPKIGLLNQAKIKKVSSQKATTPKKSQKSSKSIASSTQKPSIQKSSTRPFRLTQKKKVSSHQKRALIRQDLGQSKEVNKPRLVPSPKFTSPFVRSRLQKASLQSKIQVRSQTNPITRLKRNHHRAGQRHTEKQGQTPQENRRQALKKQRKVAQNSSKPVSNSAQSRSQSQSPRIRPRSTQSQSRKHLKHHAEQHKHPSSKKIRFSKGKSKADE